MIGGTIFFVIVEKVVTQLGKVIVERILRKTAAVCVHGVYSTGQQILLVDHVGGTMKARCTLPKAGGHEIYAAASGFQHLRVPFSSGLILTTGEGGFNDVSADHGVWIHGFHC